ncbi:MAG: hypothetical protein WBP25_14705 [Giesbergeria sp.]
MGLPVAEQGEAGAGEREDGMGLDAEHTVSEALVREIVDILQAIQRGKHIARKRFIQNECY